MKIPERIVGVLRLENYESTFEFDKDRFELKLYSPIEDEEDVQIINGIRCVVVNPKVHKFVDKTTVKGKTAEGYSVYFGVLDDPSSYIGYRTYNVIWYYITEKEENINEIRFYGGEIDHFYKPSNIFKRKIEYNSERLQSKSISVKAEERKPLSGGSYMSGDITVEITCNSYAIMDNQASSPLDSESYLRLRFSQKIDLVEMLNKARAVQDLIKYVTYRSNIAFSDILTYISIGDGRFKNIGKLVFKAECKEEQNEKAKDRVIRAEYLNDHIASVLNSIECGELPFGHFCNSIEHMTYYTISRIIMILAAFEREFRNIYGDNVRRSEDYKKTKERIIELIEDYTKDLTGKRKKYAKRFAKGIRNSDASYGDNFKYALNDCKCIMEPFILRRYNGTYEEIAEEISSRVNDLRNGIAHSRLDMELEGQHLIDIKFVEELLYVMRLKKIGIEDNTIQNVINELFNEKLPLFGRVIKR